MDFPSNGTRFLRFMREVVEPYCGLSRIQRLKHVLFLGHSARGLLALPPRTRLSLTSIGLLMRLKSTKSTIVLIVFASFGLSLAGMSGCARAPQSQEPVITLNRDATNTKEKMKMEDYINGVVAAEIRPEWPLEVLKAQAVLARTFTLQKKDEGKAKELHGTDACDNEAHFQAYDLSKVTPEVQRAVKETRGIIITYDGKPVRAWFHSSSGGKTATPAEGLNFTKEPVPYLPSVEDPYSLKNTPEIGKSWTERFAPQEVRSALAKSGLNFDSLTSAEIAGKGPSGRAITLKLNGREVNASEFRLALDPKRMRSTMIDEIRIDGGGLMIKGKGWGHGVGMPQWGAQAMAAEGKKYKDIINYYFKNVKSEQRWK